VAARVPTAIGRSKTGPSFLMSAGARLTVILREGSSQFEFRIAARTRSLASCTAVSGSPTMANAGRPPPTSTSTSIGYASSPRTAAARTFASTVDLPRALYRRRMQDALTQLSQISEHGQLESRGVAVRSHYHKNLAQTGQNMYHVKIRPLIVPK